MEKLISKLQYKNCEKGEYYKQKERNLVETIELIKTFPWAREQYAEIDLTGPSITVEDRYGNYFRVGIYYGKTHSLYYLDSKNNWYERYHVDLDDACNAITNFFENVIDLSNFKKQAFSCFKRSYLKSKSFEYKNSFWKAFILNLFWIPPIFTCTFLLIFEFKISPIAVFLSGLIPICILLYFVAFSFYRYYKMKDQHLEISLGNDEIIFGNTANEHISYNKSNISKMLVYVNKNFRHPNQIEVIKIEFIDDSEISFTNCLISALELPYKFSDKWKFETIKVETRFFKLLKLIP